MLPERTDSYGTDEDSHSPVVLSRYNLHLSLNRFLRQNGRSK